MSERGICSRREADRYIADGRVRVDGEIADTLGVRVDPQSTIDLSREARQQSRRKVTVLFNKPIGVVSDAQDGYYRQASSLIGPSSRYRNDRFPLRFNNAHLQGLAPAGRLDIESQGLLVLTQDGRIAKQLIGPDSMIDKEYLARICGVLDGDKLDRLRFGLELDGRALKRAEVNQINDQQLRITLTEGRKRQIRRMCAEVGLEVTGLKRVRIGRVRLGGLPEGQWRYLSPREQF
ncbi:MAG: 23S rRNA pseudouridine(2604) synthase [Gammaproteobacteria bacterium]|nr:23S rRNA pseudouridine(2604) synthase [Gammaproteobacteria bacterium]